MILYSFRFRYDDDPDSYIELPLSPETFTTTISNKDKTIDLISLGEANILKSIGLRSFSFKIYLPRDSVLTDSKELFHEPIFYLNKFRVYKESKKPVRFILMRQLQDGSILFNGNILVSFESYTVTEKAGEEGSFWVDIKLKEYRSITPTVKKKDETYSTEPDENGKTPLVEERQRDAKEPAKEYTVVNGDSLWKIAKLQLNDGSRYKEIAELNGIKDYNKISVGMVLKLPQ